MNSNVFGKFSITHCLFLLGLGLCAVASEASASGALDESRPSSTHAIAGEGKTLPEGVWRARTIFSSARAQDGFSDSGKKEDGGWRAEVSAGAMVIEYGIKQGLSLQLLAPYVFQAGRALNGNKFKNSSLYSRLYEKSLEKVSEKLISKKICLDAQACRKAIEEKNLALPYDTTLVLDTGESLPVKGGVPLKAVLESLIVNAAAPSSGRVGLGDIEVGALWALSDPQVGWKKDWGFNASIGAGLRVPIGSFSDVPAAQRPTGRGTWDLGLRANVDKAFAESLLFSWQNQSEIAILPARKKRSSLLNSNSLNTANPAVEGADGKSNDGILKRTGVRQTGFLKVAWGAENLHSSFDGFILNAFLKYDLDTQGEREGESLGPDSALYSLQCGLTWDGLRLNLPVQLDFDASFPIAGKSVPAAPVAASGALKVYYKF
ncbi:MAG: hypothetical protein RIR26_2151 [Pseudomonadota bacterium]|jgi:hypothetical protein